MKFKFFLCLICLSLASIALSGQKSSFEELENELAFHADVMINASKSQHRLAAANSFISTFRKTLSQANSYDYPFDSLIWISKVEPKDHSFRIFSWQLKTDDEKFSYFGFMQTEEGYLSELKESSLADKSIDFEYEYFEAANWYGQLYFNLLEKTIRGEKHYYLFGYRKMEKGNKRKLVERIKIENGKVTFGEESFFKSSRHGSMRVFIDYARTASATLNYDPSRDMIVFDHLVPVLNPYESNEMMMVPDGTLEAYKFKKGQWKYMEYLPNEKYDTPPVPQPLLKNRSKDIFGK